MSNLNPCPFCGSDELETTETDPIQVQCLKCGAKGPTGETWFEAELEFNERQSAKELPNMWPEGLKAETFYTFLCDDEGSDGGTFFCVFVAGDGDVYLRAQEWHDIKRDGTQPDPFPAIRCRTGQGGGRHMRTRLALLWLADAIRRDNEELGIDPDKM